MYNLFDVIKSIITETKSHNDFKSVSFDNINKIHITVMDNNIEWLGMIAPSISNNKLVFELFVQNSIFEDLLSNDNDKKLYAKSIIIHELYHLKELSISNNKIDIMPIYNIKRNCTRSLLINLGYKQWTEYYAHYNSAKYYCPPVNLSNVIYQSEISLTVIKRELYNSQDIQLPEFIYKNIEDFISFTVKLAAIYNQSKNDDILNHLQKYKNNTLYMNHFNYIYKIISYMDNIYQAYPDWVSEEKFLVIGKRLFSIVHDYNITYSTNDLSDNFIFISTK